MELIEILKKLNLTERQAKVYLACLETGISGVYKIAKQAQLPRSSVYEILEELKNKNLVETVNKTKIKQYAAVSPENLIKQTKENLKQLEFFLPQLKLLLKSTDKKPKIKFYEGQKGVKQAWQEILISAKKTKKIAAFSTLEAFKLLPKYFPKFREERIKNKIFARIFLTDSPVARKYQTKAKQNYQIIKLLPPEFSLTLSLNIVDDKIFILSHNREIFAIVLESQAVAENFLKIFNFIWLSH